MNYKVKKTDALTPDNVDWDNIPMLSLVSNDGEQSPYQTDFRMCQGDGKLFFRFDCDDDGVKATMTEFNAPLYDEEVVEIFLSSNGNIREYLEVEVNALGGVFLADAYNDMAGKVSLEYVSENCLNATVTKDGDDWSVVGELPRKLFKGDFDGVWSFNAYRIKRDENNGMILMAYSPTMVENFHKPECFATLEFE